jgi:hypothetical protein
MILPLKKPLAQNDRKTRHPVWDRNSWFSRTSSGLRNALQQLAITQVAAVVMIPCLAWYVWKQVDGPVVLIEPISVPSQYKELGFTSSVMSQRILETIEIIEKSTKTIQHRDQLGQPSDPDAIADCEVPGTKLSVRAMVNFFRQFFQFGQMRIAGEITYIGPLKLPAINLVSAEAHVTTQITLRLSEGTDNKVILTFIAPSNGSDIVIKKMSEAILRRLNPYVLVAYMSSSDNKLEIRRAITIVQELIDNSNKSSHNEPIFQEYSIN